MPNILVNNNFYQGTASACINDVTPPTFAGIATASVQSRGQIRATWLAATDPTPPIRYEVYIQATTATGLFNVANIIAITDKLQYDTFTLPDGSFLVNGTTYYLGVRAIDGVSNRNTNTASIGVISTGVSVNADVYMAEGAFAINTSHQLQGTLWALKNSILAKTGNAVMGTASYQVYDKTGAPVAGMNESGIAADANGQYKITPVASSLSSTLDHYMVKISIIVDGQAREGYVALIEPVPEYEIHGTFAVNSSQQLTATFWTSADEEAITNVARLGTASYQVYDRDGNIVAGMAQTGITPDSNGLFKITPVASTMSLDLNYYSVKVTVTVDGVARTNFLPIQGKIPNYTCRVIWSINALNQLQATIWAEVDGIARTTGLGTASYTIYDAAGNPVSGLTQSGMTANGLGEYHITPVSAVLLTDLTHFRASISITVDSAVRTTYRGFQLFGS